MNRLLALRRGSVACLLSVLCTTALVAAERQDLAQLIPADAGLCVEIHDLSGALAALEDGPLVARWRQVPELAALLGLLQRDVEKNRTALRGQLGISKSEATTLFGGELTVAVWPPRTSGEQGTGIALIACEDRDLLQRVAAHIVDQQRKSGKLGEERTVHVGDRDVVVHAMLGSDGAQSQLAVVDDVAILATNVSALDRVVAGLSKRRISEPLADLAAYQAGIKRLDPAAPIRVFLNPRVWDEAMQASPIPPAKRARFVRDGILGAWEASEYCVASATLAPDLQVELFLACEQSRLPEPFRTLAASASGSAQLAARLPADSLAVVAARLDAGQMLRALFDTDTVARYWTRLPTSLGWAGGMALLGGMGPNAAIALCPASAPDGAEGGSPLSLVAGVATQPIEHDADGEPLGPELMPLVRETFRWLAKAAETQPDPGEEGKPRIRAKTYQRAGIELFGITGLASDRPKATLFVAEDPSADSPLLWLGSTAERVAQAATSAPTTEESRWLALHNARLGAPSDFVYFDLARLRVALAGAPEASARLLAPKSVEIGQRKLEELLPRLQAADALLGELRIDAHGLGASLRVHCD